MSRLQNVGARAVLDLLDRKITKEQAVARLVDAKKRRPDSCKVGSGGICETHGQLIHECRDEDA